MNKKTILLLAGLVAGSQLFAQNNTVESWMTLSDKSVLFEKQNKALKFQTNTTPNTLPSVIVDEKKTFQKMDGFGFTLTGGSATLIHKMSESARKALLKELFDTNDKNIGISFLRISIGASDLSEKVFSYNDLKSGEYDPKILKFDMSEEKKDLIPILKEILAINPKIKILGSPWSPPVWMKTNYDSKGGSLRTDFYAAYATYFVKYIQAMQKEGIAIDAITIQNEPLHPGNNPSLLMYPYEQANFIKKNLGPAFKSHNIKTKIWLYDHNADRPDYPLQILNDLDANKYIDGSAFHLYGGSVEAIGEVHEAFPNKNVYFTEQWTGSKGTFTGDLNWHTRTLVIGASRNWCKTVLEWNLAADPSLNPHTEGGCTECLGALTIDNETVTRNVAYYIIAHASKFVRPYSTRIFSNQLGDVSNVTYKTPSGKVVMIAQNESDKEQTFNILYRNQRLTYSLPAKAVVTLVW